MTARMAIGTAFLVLACGGDAADPDAAPQLDAPPPDAMSIPDATASRERLSEVGLYRDIGDKTLAPGVVEFAPTYKLWSDGAVKTRWISLPAGATIDSGDIDHWQLPVGTKLFKEFVRDGVRVETRLIERTGPGPFDYWMGAFIWELDESEAYFAPDGGTDVNGTDHDVPDDETCWTCHIGETTRSLGFSALQLAGPTLQSLIDDGLLTDPPASTDLGPPGDAGERAALGYLHANCGHCHNPLGQAWPDTDLVLRLDTGDRTVTATTIYQSAVGVALDHWSNPGFAVRIAPGDSAASAVVHRMGTRGDMDQMPPIATELPDATGAAAVTAWIDGL
jgi:hypothetical protein